MTNPRRTNGGHGTTTGEEYRLGAGNVTPIRSGWNPHYGDISSTGGSGSGGGGVEARIAKLEASVEHIQGDIGEIKHDYRHILYGGIGAFILTWGGLLVIAQNMYDKSENINSSISSLAIQQEKTTSSFAVTKNRLDDVDSQYSDITRSINDLKELLNKKP